MPTLTLDEAIFKRATTGVGSTALTTLISTRIYPGIVPQAASLPAVVFFKVGDPPNHVMGSDATLYCPTYQFSVFSTGKSQARTVAKAVRNRFRDYSGVLGGVGGVPVQRCFFEGEMDLNEGGDIMTVNPSPITHIVQSYVIWHTSST